MRAGKLRSAAAWAGAAGAMVALSLSSGSADARRTPVRPDLKAPAARQNITEAAAEQLGTQAYSYGIPLMEFLRQARRQTSVTVPNALSDAPLEPIRQRPPASPPSRDQVIVQPNNDTLYTMGHLDLGRSAPLVLHVPAVPDRRYYSFEFLDPYTNVFYDVGTRTTGDGAGTFLITGPRFTRPCPGGS